MILAFAQETLVVVENPVVETLTEYAQMDGISAEAGGILIGCYRGPHIEVCDCTRPKPADRRSRHLFDRVDAGHDLAAKEAWLRSNRTQTFVGEWHTHPEDHPSPSLLDRRTWGNVMRHHLDGPVLFLIVGRHRYWAGLGSNGTVFPALFVELEKPANPRRVLTHERTIAAAEPK